MFEKARGQHHDSITPHGNHYDGENRKNADTLTPQRFKILSYVLLYILNKTN